MTTIYNNEGFLNFSTGNLATVEDFEKCDRCTGSIFEALNPGETIILAEGSFILDDDLDIQQ